MARRTRYAEYKDRYANFRFELSEEGILLMQCHTKGGSLVWDWKVHDEMSYAFADVAGDRTGMTGVQLADGEVIAREGGFLRPRYATGLEYLQALAPETGAEGLLVVDAEGRTAVPGLYAAGDVTPPGPQQLIVAAGAGARTASAVHRDLLRAALDG